MPTYNNNHASKLFPIDSAMFSLDINLQVVSAIKC